MTLFPFLLQSFLSQFRNRKLLRHLKGSSTVEGKNQDNDHFTATPNTLAGILLSLIVHDFHNIEISISPNACYFPNRQVLPARLFYSFQHLAVCM